MVILVGTKKIFNSFIQQILAERPATLAQLSMAYVQDLYPQRKDQVATFIGVNTDDEDDPERTYTLSSCVF